MRMSNYILFDGGAGVTTGVLYSHNDHLRLNLSKEIRSHRLEDKDGQHTIFYIFE